MNISKATTKLRAGFTIVELVVVIAVIGILATITVVSYGAWRKSTLSAQVKSDLNGAASAMESARTFNNTYPAAIPSTISASNGVTLTLSGGGATYCIDGASTADATIVYYVDSTASDKGAQAGTCATRPNLPGPGIPSNLAIVSSTGTQVNLSWSAATNATNYTAQCASDAVFINGIKEATQPGTSASISGLTMSSSFYCRVKTVNNTGSSAWSATVSTTTTNAYGSLAVASSIEGYWTSAPQGFLLEDGSAVSRTTYADLFAVIGTTYGAGDGFMTFNLPDSRGRTPINLSASDTEFNTMGEKYGEKAHTVTIAEMPSHTHLQDAHTHGVWDPGHNHSQNAHNHTTRSTMDGGLLGLTGGGQGGWGLSAGTNNNIYRLITAPTTATNNASTAGISLYSTTATNQYVGGDGSHNEIQPSIVKSFAIKYASIDPSAATQPAATSISGYWSVAPTDYLLEDGSAVSRTTYANLFAIIGTTYGVGNGSTTFNLPDSRGRASVNLNASDAEFNTMGEKYGTKAETLTIAQIPSHTHLQDPHTHGVFDPGHNHSQNPHNHGTNSSMNGDAIGISGSGGNQGGWGLLNTTNNNVYQLVFSVTTATNNAAVTGITVNSTTATNQNTGGNGPHNNIQPSIAKMFAIKYTPAINTGTPITTATSIEGYWSAAPTGFLPEDGSAVSRATYADLFTIIGTTYGTGDGSTTFNLPNSRGRTNVNKNILDPEFTTLGQITGSKTETLTTAQMPSHTHIQDAHTQSINDPGHNHSQNPHTHDGRSSINGDFIGLSGGGQGGWGIAAGTNNAIYRMTTTDTTATNNAAVAGIGIYNTTATNQNTGGNGSHNNIQPSIVKMFAIKY